MRLKNILNIIGIDKAIIFTSSTSIIGIIGGMGSIFLVLKYLTGIEQGFYYTFGSIAAIQVFFELGLNNIITQYVAHENSNLKWENNFLLSGESKFKSRLSSLLKFSIKWYLCFALLLLLVLILFGFVFFKKFDMSPGLVSWEKPWLLLSVGTALNLIVSPILAFLQGLGKVKEIAKIQFDVQLFRIAMVWAGLAFGGSLYVVGLSSIFSAMLLLIIIYSKYKEIIISIWKTEIIEKVNYRKEIFPYQWKIALSWISGYFIFQLFNPVLFATEGAIVAGQMGMTLSVLNGLLALSFSWMTTKVTLFSGLVAQKSYRELDKIFNMTLKQSVFINIATLLFLFFVIFIIRINNVNIYGKSLGLRFLDYVPLIFMMIPALLNHFTSSWAIYLRCHKEDPYLLNSVVGGVLCTFSTFFLGRYFGIIGITSGYCALSLMMFPWGYRIFKNKKHEWHIE
jgi:O-antigen/teichoic acid export membrane protein